MQLRKHAGLLEFMTFSARGRLVLTPLGFSLLRQLSDGAFHSGEDLAATVGLTRARVSQLLKQAETAGLVARARPRPRLPPARHARFPRRRGRALGARRARRRSRASRRPAPLLPAANDDDIALPARRCRAFRATRRSPSRSSTRSIRRRASCCAARRAATSTARCWRPNGRRAGRGRRGRVWTAVAGGSLTFSLGWRFEQGAGFIAGLSLAVGVAVVRALEAEGFAGVELKWPNDLVYRHLKVGGILVELNGDALGPVDGRRRRRPQRAPAARRSSATSRSRSATSPRSPAAARRRSTATGCSRALRPSSRPRSRTYARAGLRRRSPPNGSAATRTRASR